MKRSIIIVLDSAGIGELPDACKYGDEGSNTLGNISDRIAGFSLPNMQKLGLGNIDGIKGFEGEKNCFGSFGRMKEMSKGKDTTTGHWEIAGLRLEKAFPVYPDGFPIPVIQRFENAIGRKVLGNYPASGTEIIMKLGDEHVRTGFPIVYTSADSVFQIAAHESVIPVDKLYEMCEIARDILQGEHAVARVIARPFEGESGSYKRTLRRKDFSLKPIGETVLDLAVKKGLEVKAVGKIEDIFAGQGITYAVHTKNNSEGIEKTIQLLEDSFEGIIFTNLVDFDMLYGHRNDVEGYARALKEFDDNLPLIINNLKQDDLLIITADHGCDPTTPGTDHSREYVPLLLYGRKIKTGVNLGTRETFSDVAATVAEYLDIGQTLYGTSFLKHIL